MIRSKILADSVNPTGSRLTTFELVYPRMVHSEVMTHCLFARNAASSRAIPIKKMIEAVQDNPAEFVFYGANQAGMQAHQQLDAESIEIVREVWLLGRDNAVATCKTLSGLGLHKQSANRVLEPFAHMTTIVTGESRGLRNFFSLRAHPDAQPEFQVLAYNMLQQWLTHLPAKLDFDQWHTPLGRIHPDDAQLAADDLLKVSTGRVARVSYLTHDGRRDVTEDIALHDRLATSGHWSPFEHICQAIEPEGKMFKFGDAWKPYRANFAKECAAPTDEELWARLENMPEWARPFVPGYGTAECVA